MRMIEWAASVSLSALVLVVTSAQAPELVIESGHKNGSTRVYGFTPDSRVLLTGGGSDGTMKLWSVATGQMLKTFTNPASPIGTGISAAALSPDGTLIASRVENVISVWNASDGKLQFTVTTGSQPAYAFEDSTIAFSSDNRLVAIGTGDSVVVSDLKANRYLGSINAQQVGIVAAGFLPGSWTLATLDKNNKLAIRKLTPDPPSVDTISAVSIDMPSFGAHALDVAHGRLATTISEISVNNDIAIFDIATGSLIKRVSSGLSTVLHLTLSPDGNYLAASGSYTQGNGPDVPFMTVTDLNNGTVVSSHSSESPGLIFSRPAFSDDGSILCVSISGSAVEAYDPLSGRHIRSIGATGGEVAALAFSPVAPTLAIGTAEGALVVIDVSEGSVVRPLRGHPSPTVAYENGGSNDLDPEIYAVQYSPDGKTIASAGISSFRIWDAETGDLIRTLREPARAGSLAFAPDGKTIGLAGEEFTFHTWDLTGKPVVTFNLKRSFIYSIVFSPEGKSVAVGSFYKVQIFDAVTGAETATPIKDAKKAQQALAFSFDGSTLAIGDSEGVIRIWDVAGQQIVKTLSGHKNGVNSVKFLRDGRLVSGSVDGTVKLWDVASGSLIRTFSGHLADVLSVAASSDGRVIASGSRDGTTKLWNTNTGDLFATITILGKTDWVVTRPDGRFDTNKPLDNIQGLHWLIPGGGLRPFALDLFTRQYYEPGLLTRSLKCGREASCAREFKELPSIGKIDFARPTIQVNLRKKG